MMGRVKIYKCVSFFCCYDKLVEVEKFIWERIVQNMFLEIEEYGIFVFLVCDGGCVLFYGLRERGRKMGMEEILG